MVLPRQKLLEQGHTTAYETSERTHEDRRSQCRLHGSKRASQSLDELRSVERSNFLGGRRHKVYPPNLTERAARLSRRIALTSPRHVPLGLVFRVRYFSPYVSVRLESMAEAFGMQVRPHLVAQTFGQKLTHDLSERCIWPARAPFVTGCCL